MHSIEEAPSIADVGEQILSLLWNSNLLTLLFRDIYVVVDIPMV